MSSSRDSAPDSGPETLPDSNTETRPGHSLLAGVQPAAAQSDEILSLSPPTESSVEPRAQTTKGGTQISTFRAERQQSTLNATHRSAVGPEPDSGPPERSAPSIRVTDDRLHSIEHRLDRLDARMRLLEKGAERSGANQRAHLLWWGALLAILVLWALSSRLR